MKKMKILVACEESQAVTKELRDLGHEAFSCDLEPCSGNYPEWHLQQDAAELLEQKWDMIIAFPPCTYMTNGGGGRLEKKNYKGKSFANVSTKRSKTFSGIAKAMANQWT